MSTAEYSCTTSAHRSDKRAWEVAKMARGPVDTSSPWPLIHRTHITASSSPVDVYDLAARLTAAQYEHALSAVLSPAGVATARTALEFSFIVSVNSKPSITPTGDGGVTISFENSTASRELVFSVPHDGEMLYFVASSLDDDADWHAGIVKDLNASLYLAEWLNGSREKLPSSGLVLPSE